MSCVCVRLHSDQDKGDGSLKYILSGDGAGTLFVIDEKTGDIHATRRIDREEKAFYTLRAQAINRRTLRPVEPESEFVIKIHDINDNEPMFPEEVYIASVPEMSMVGCGWIKERCLLKLFPTELDSQPLSDICNLFVSQW
uniref:Cadherin-10 n=1 Tax=Sphaerodactylus townsendi TaxID=933632 RepID=A0ACB8FCW7_9SAUR